MMDTRSFLLGAGLTLLACFPFVAILWIERQEARER